MNDLAVIVPDPSPMLDVRSVCSTVVLWAESTTDVTAIADNSAKLAAIATYVAQTSRDGLACLCCAEICWFSGRSQPGRS